MEDLINVLGVLGAYFAVLLVLAVAVETILDPIKMFRPLQKRASPEQVMKDLDEWLPQGSGGRAKATTIAGLVEQFEIGAEDIGTRVNEIGSIVEETADALGIGATVDEAERSLAVWISAIRRKHTLDTQRRIVFLRVSSAAIGIALAIALQIDTFGLLGDLFPLDAQGLFNHPFARYGGMVLTGFAASAGSSFWHDQLGKVRAVKEASRKVQDVTTG